MHKRNKTRDQFEVVVKCDNMSYYRTFRFKRHPTPGEVIEAMTQYGLSHMTQDERDMVDALIVRSSFDFPYLCSNNNYTRVRYFANGGEFWVSVEKVKMFWNRGLEPPAPVSPQELADLLKGRRHETKTACYDWYYDNCTKVLHLAAERNQSQVSVLKELLEREGILKPSRKRKEDE